MRATTDYPLPAGRPAIVVTMGVGVGAMEASSCPAGDDGGGGGGATTIEDIPADVLALVLRRLDGASLAAVGCVSSGLHGLATDQDTWRALCLAMWPSVRDLLPCLGGGGGGVDHRALFADAFPFPSSDSPSPSSPSPSPLPARLVSAVDLRHAGVTILSRVVDTDAASDWFLGAPFRVDALLQEGFTAPSPAASSSSSSAASPSISPADLELSWVLLDPSTGRAINASSRRAVAVDRKWLTGDTVARFAVVLGAGLALDAAVTCDERYGHVREISLRVEDADGAGVSGRDGLAAVAAAMAAPRRCRGGGAAAEEEEDAARVRYEEFVRGKRARKEWKARREGFLDLCCSGVGAAAFLGFLVMLTFR